MSKGVSGVLGGSGDFPIEVVGVYYYQKALSTIHHKGLGVKEVVECVATLVLEDDNLYDDCAVRVDIGDKKVGYLSREMARAFRTGLNNMLDGAVVHQVECPARCGRRRGYVNVFLDLPVRDLGLV